MYGSAPSVCLSVNTVSFVCISVKMLFRYFLAPCTHSDTSFDMIGKPYSSHTCLKCFFGLTQSTLSNVLTNCLISGYSSPVSTNTALMPGYVCLAMLRSTVESFPPEKLNIHPVNAKLIDP